jgi:hypothetical protein
MELNNNLVSKVLCGFLSLSIGLGWPLRSALAEPDPGIIPKNQIIKPKVTQGSASGTGPKWTATQPDAPQGTTGAEAQTPSMTSDSSAGSADATSSNGGAGKTTQNLGEQANGNATSNGSQIGGKASDQLKDAADSMQSGLDNCDGSPNCSKTFDGGQASSPATAADTATVGGTQPSINQTGHRVEYSAPDVAPSTTGAEAAAPGMSGAQAALIGAGLGLGVVGLVVAAVGSIPSTSTSSTKYCGSWNCGSSSQCAYLMGGYSGTRTFSSMSACQYYFANTTFGSSCRSC